MHVCFEVLLEFLNLIQFCLSYSDFKILAIFRTLNFEARFTPVPDEGSYLAQRLAIYVPPISGRLVQSPRDGYAQLEDSLLNHFH